MQIRRTHPGLDAPAGVGTAGLIVTPTTFRDMPPAEQLAQLIATVLLVIALVLITLGCFALFDQPAPQTIVRTTHGLVATIVR